MCAPGTSHVTKKCVFLGDGSSEEEPAARLTGHMCGRARQVKIHIRPHVVAANGQSRLSPFKAAVLIGLRFTCRGEGPGGDQLRTALCSSKFQLCRPGRAQRQGRHPRLQRLDAGGRPTVGEAQRAAL
jgi:hypothetical protein